jgi:hypothetical protein
MYTYRKPVNAIEAITLVEHSGVKTVWDITNKNNMEASNRYFEAYKPVVFVYKNDKLVAAAHNKDGKVHVIDTNDRHATEKYDKTILNEIDLNLRQLELF